MSGSTIHVGDLVNVTSVNVHGVVRYSDSTDFAPGHWIGVELDTPTGKNDGSVAGKRYFQCKSGHGMFVREGNIKVIERPQLRAAVSTKPGINGTTKKPRPSSGLTAAAGAAADPTRKRQSVAPSSSNSSRLSIRSPTKSPTKPASAAATSAGPGSRSSMTPSSRPSSVPGTKPRASIGGAVRQSMGPPAAPARGSRPVRQSITTARKPDSAGKTVGTTPRSSGGQSSTDVTEVSEQASNLSEDPILSPSQEQEYAPDEAGEEDTVEAIPHRPATTRQVEAKPTRPELANSTTKTASPKPKPSTYSTIGSSSAVSKENEQLKAKLKVMEKKRMEDREKLKEREELQQEKERLQGLIQKLQQKFGPQQEELAELRKQLADAAAIVERVEREEAEKDSMIEMANIDKETADEMAEFYKSELETIKAQKEELELEVDVLRQENELFNEDIPDADKSTQGWMQMEREKTRLREALVRLKEYSQDREDDLNSQLKGMTAEVEELEGTRQKYEQAKEQLKKHSDTIDLLRSQLDAAEAQDEVIDGLTETNNALHKEMEGLRRTMEEYEEMIAINDEMEADHQAAQKELQAELDYREGMVMDLRREFATKLRDIEELQYMAGRYKDAMAAYEKQFEEMRQSSQISETASAELSEKSRTVMDLQRRLQSTESKAQSKRIDDELQKLKAEESAEHLSILQNFIVESFERDKRPVEALLRFRRIAFKSLMMETVLRDESSMYLSKDITETILTIELEERLDWISGTCTRFVTFGSSCSVEEFAALGQAYFETESLERSLNVWIDALRINELDRKHCAAELSKFKAILIDLSEKLIPSTLATEADALYSQTLVVQSCLSSVATLLPILQKTVTDHAVSEEDMDVEVEGNSFSKNIQSLDFAARSTKVVAGKAAHAIDEMIQRSLSFNGASSELFEPTQNLAQSVASIVRNIVQAVQTASSDEHRESAMTYSDYISIINETARGALHGSDRQRDTFATLSEAFEEIHVKLSELVNQATDISRSTEFERRPAPWMVRAKELKANRELSAETEETLRRLQADLRDKVEILAGKDQKLEEQHLRIELLESRTKDGQKQAATVKDLESKLEEARAAMQQAQADYSSMAAEYENLKRNTETDKSQLDAFKRAQLIEGGGGGVGGGISATAGGIPIVDQSAALAMEYQLTSLKQEIDSLQAAIRYFKEENHRLQMPLTQSDLLSLGNNSWLTTPLPVLSRRRPSPAAAPSNSNPKPQQPTTTLAQESHALITALLDSVTESFNPIDLSSPSLSPSDDTSTTTTKTSWRPQKSTPRYQVLRQREQLERWDQWKDDLVVRKSWAERSGNGRVGSERKSTAAAAALTNHNNNIRPPEKPLEGAQKVQIVSS